MVFAAGFYDGEENVTRTLTPYLTAIEKLEAPPSTRSRPRCI
jgi:hypothetical protein